MSQVKRVYLAIRDEDAACMSLIEAATGVPRRNVYPILRVLRLRGFIEDTGERRVFGENAGALQKVWRATGRRGRVTHYIPGVH